MTIQCRSCGGSRDSDIAACPRCSSPGEVAPWMVSTRRLPEAPVGGEVPDDRSTAAPGHSAVRFDSAGTFYQPVVPSGTDPGSDPPPTKAPSAPWMAAVPRIRAPQPHATTSAGQCRTPAGDVHVVVVRGHDAGLMLRVEDGWIVGSAVEAPVRLRDSGVAHHHGRFECRSGSIRFVPVGPARVEVVRSDGNARTMAGPVTLGDGDTLVIGETYLRVVVVESDTPDGLTR